VVWQNAPVFRYHPRVLARFPGLRAGVVLAGQLDAHRSVAALDVAFAAEQQAVRAKLGSTALAEIPSIAAWRRVFSAFGVSPTKHRNAAEALLRRLTQKGEIPSINPLVDIGNLTSIRHALPVLVVDTALISGEIAVAEAKGDEHFDDLGGEESGRPEPGEIIFIDEAGQTIARRWCWRQSRRSAARHETTEALFVVEAHHEGAEADIAAALATLISLLHEYVPGATTRVAQVDPGSPVF